MAPIARLSPSVVLVLGCNPGAYTLHGTNTYLVGRGRRRVLVDAGEGAPEYPGLLRRAMAQEGCEALSAVLVTHRHYDHLGGLPALRAGGFGGVGAGGEGHALPAYKCRVGDADADRGNWAGMEGGAEAGAGTAGGFLDIADGQVFEVPDDGDQPLRVLPPRRSTGPAAGLAGVGCSGGHKGVDGRSGGSGGGGGGGKGGFVRLTAMFTPGHCSDHMSFLLEAVDSNRRSQPPNASADADNDGDDHDGPGDGDGHARSSGDSGMSARIEAGRPAGRRVTERAIFAGDNVLGKWFFSSPD
jgi:glyoxylase-like metal-dependent hydrolase (beta-lactamase superfamily II)